MSKKEAVKTGGSPFKRVLLLLAVAVIAMVVLYFNFMAPSSEQPPNPAEQRLFTQLEERQAAERISPELRAAKEAYEQAFERYTLIATGGAEGDIEAAKAEYEQTYQRYKALVEAAPPQAQQGTAPLEAKGIEGVGDLAAEATRSARIGAGGGLLELPGGERLQIPAGAWDRPVEVVFSRLTAASDEMQVYQLTCEGLALRRPAVLELPVATKAGSPALMVDVLHFHDPDDLGTRLQVDWQPGQEMARVELEEFSVLGMVLVYGVITWVAGEEVILRNVSNTEAHFLAAAKAALAHVKHPSVRLNVPVYDQHHPETYWCWACTHSAMVQAARPLEAHLKEPLKPQAWVHAAGGYDRSGWRGGPSGLNWSTQSLGYLSRMESLAGAPVEARAFTSYPRMIVYLIQCLDAGYPVAVDVRAKTHTVLFCGYDRDGAYIQDPSNKTANKAAAAQPSKASWANIFSILNSGTTFFTNNFALTTLIKKSVHNRSIPLSMNISSLEWGTTGTQNGWYATLGERGKFAGFQWDGRTPYGMKLVYNGAGESPKPLSVLPVGINTRTGLRDLEIGNTSATAQEVTVAFEWVSKEGAPVTLREEKLTAPPQVISTHTLAEQELLPLLPAYFGPGGAFWLTLYQSGQPIDRIRLPLGLAVLRLDEVRQMSGQGGKVLLQVKGTGLSNPGLMLYLADGQAFPLDVSSDALGSVLLPLPPEKVAGETYLGFGPGAALPWKGVQSNKVAILGQALRQTTSLHGYVNAYSLMKQAHMENIRLPEGKITGEKITCTYTFQGKNYRQETQSHELGFGFYDLPCPEPGKPYQVTLTCRDQKQVITIDRCSSPDAVFFEFEKK